MSRRKRREVRNGRDADRQKKNETAEDLFGVGPRNWAALWAIGGFVVLGSLFPASMMFPIFAGEAPYDSREFSLPLLFLALLVFLASMIPHAFVSQDGSLPSYTDERYSPALFWYLVAVMAICGLLLALAPALPLFDGYGLTTDARIPKLRSWHSGYAPLWLLAPEAWAGSAVVFFYLVRGVRRRFTRQIPFRSYRGARARR